jgi:hypothetical protein
MEILVNDLDCRLIGSVAVQGFPAFRLRAEWPGVISAKGSSHGESKMPEAADKWRRPRLRRHTLSCFSASHSRISAALAARRKEMVTALANEVFIARITSGGQMERIVEWVKAWRIPFSCSW